VEAQRGTLCTCASAPHVYAYDNVAITPESFNSAFVGFWCLDDNTIKGLIKVFSVGQELSEKHTKFNTRGQCDIPYRS
jgi:hypothetical protein